MSIPQLRVPFTYVEFDPSRAFQGPSILAYTSLMFGQRLSTGTKGPLTKELVTSADQGKAFYGAGSQLARMLEKYFLNNNIVPIYVISMDDDGGAVAATGTVTIVGTATKAGTVSLYLAGRLVSAPVTVGDSETDVADSIVAAITADPDLAFSAGNTLGIITLTAKNLGLVANQYDVRLNYNDEELPEGITAVIVDMSGGTTNPDIQDAIDIIGTDWYNTWVGPYSDAANLTAIETELTIRFGPTVQTDGVYFTTQNENVANLVSFGTGRNSPHVSTMSADNVPTAVEEMASAFMGQVALEGQADPARPYQTLALLGVLAPNSLQRHTVSEDEQLLRSGIATHQVSSGGVVSIQRAITMYQKNPADADDIAYLDVNTMTTLMFLRFDFRSQILTRYPRAKLADDGAILPTGQQILTPSGGRAEAVSIFRGWQALGLVENIEQFKNDLIVERDVSDPNRMNWLLPPDLINQLRVNGATIQFLLAQPV